MEKQIENILIKVDEGTMPVQQALSELLLLFSVSKSVCNCRVCGKETDYDLKDKLCPNCW